MNVPRWFEFKLNSFYAEIWPFGRMLIVDWTVVVAGRGIRCHWIDIVRMEFRFKLTDSKCIRVENWKRPVHNALFPSRSLPLSAYMYTCQSTRICQSTDVSRFDWALSIHRTAEVKSKQRKKRTKLLTYVKHVVQTIFEIGYNSSMVFLLWHNSFGFWIKRMHQNHSSNVNSKTLSSLFDLDCLLS